MTKKSSGKSRSRRTVQNSAKTGKISRSEARKIARKVSRESPGASKKD